MPEGVGAYKYRREELKAAFVGKLANMANDKAGFTDEEGKRSFYPKRAFKKSTSAPNTHRQIAMDSDQEWYYEALHGYGHDEGTVVFIIDVVRCHDFTKVPTWGAIFLLEEKHWMMPLDDLVLGTET
jgi:hypothetical protein